ncbi:MAG: zinc-binding dehydrogenase [Chloroflexota bacterium]
MSVRAAVMDRPNDVAIREFDRPRIGPDAALIQIEMAGICGSDPKLFRGELTWAPFPIVPGHETLGRLVEVGELFAAGQNVKVGDRVIVEANVKCGSCGNCQRGAYNLCTNIKIYGLRVASTMPPHLWGAWAEYMYLAPGSSVHKIRDDVPAAAAVLANAVVANGIQWLRNLGGANIGDACVIQGPGAIGLTSIVAAKESGCNPVILTGLGHHEDRFEIARAFGADHCINTDAEDPVARVREITGGKMADIVMDVTGDVRTLDTSIKMLRKTGTFVLGGILPETAGNVPVSFFNDIVMNQIRLQGVQSKTGQAVAAAIKIIESGKYPLERIMTKVYALDDAHEALRAMGREIDGFRPIKVAIDPRL